MAERQSKRRSAKKDELVAASFHYLCRVVVEKGKRREIPFTEAEFSALFDALEKKPKLNKDDAAALDRVRFRLDAPIEEVEREGAQKIFGRFQGSYWGHSYLNTEKGEIPANSVNLRPFFFLLYLSKAGRIYIGAQYLGHYGGYTALERTVRDLLNSEDRIESHSLRLSGVHYKDVQAKEVQVRFSAKPTSIAAKNRITDRGMFVLRKAGKNDGFEEQVAKNILPFVGRPVSAVKKQIASILNESSLIDVEDSDIVDCTLIGDLNGKRQTIYMIDSGSFATRFPLDVKIDAQGHPVQADAKAAMMKVLEDEIMARGQNV